MRQSRPEMVASAIQKNLGLVLQPAKGSRMNNSGTIALKFSPVSVAWLGITPSLGITRSLSEWGEGSPLIRFHSLARLPLLTRNEGVVRVTCHNCNIRQYVRFASAHFAEHATVAHIAFSTLLTTLGFRNGAKTEKSTKHGSISPI
jgi:hypothetical protein